MAIRKIITLPDPRLRQVSQPVAAIDDAIHCLVADMLETMYAAPGIGLAAVQIGVLTRVIVADVGRDKEAPRPVRLINPEIVWRSEECSVYQEGCLSIPEHFEDVERSAQCRIRHLDLSGNVCELECDGLLATVVQHEVDHINGVLFIDHLSRLKRQRILKKFSKSRHENATA